jgi:hypothetical protein
MFDELGAKRKTHLGFYCNKSRTKYPRPAGWQTCLQRVFGEFQQGKYCQVSASGFCNSRGRMQLALLGSHTHYLNG